ncbi:MAG: 16S rRNA (guanine(966)-N(2))-methyltransferase RsmD [Proteobacteria bacterium]|nr:16S rRNA (guanine(966)-N(2))-methyltransferase RsmD [Pseudomonadota bacterium]
MVNVPSKSSQGILRIIGGKWRSRRIRFSETGVRPTPDRVRETLFNWLAPIIPGAHCLDLFAGSGVLSFEALSRGAASIVTIDQSAEAIRFIEQNKQLLQAENMQLIKMQIPGNLSIEKKSFDIIFMDPPFHQGLIELCCAWLREKELLAPNAYIYIETEADLNPLPIPSDWEIFREKKAGQVKYYLCRPISI